MFARIEFRSHPGINEGPVQDNQKRAPTQSEAHGQSGIALKTGRQVVLFASDIKLLPARAQSVEGTPKQLQPILSRPGRDREESHRRKAQHSSNHQGLTQKDDLDRKTDNKKAGTIIEQPAKVLPPNVAKTEFEPLR